MRKKIILVSAVVIIASFLITPLMAFSSETETNATRTDAWILELQENFDNPQWFYDNLNQADRQKIRQAMDYAIPRQAIIDTLMNGLGQVVNSFVIPQNGDFYNDTIQPRPFNTTASLDLLEVVFGYRFDFDGDDDPLTPFDDTLPYFPMTTIVPTTNDLRTQWAGRTALAWQSIGIDVTQKHLTWGITIPRLITNIAGQGYDYAHGGFDVWFVGMDADPTPTMRGFFHSDFMVPSGDNYYFMNDSYIDGVLDATMEDPVRANRVAATHEFQQWVYDYVPASVIRQEVQTWGVDEDLQGFSPFGVWYYENITHPTQDTIVIAMPAELVDTIALLSDSYYDAYVFDAINGGNRRGGLFSLMTPDGDDTYQLWSADPYLAKAWNVSADEMTWEISIHDGLLWHDGETLDADDIVFSYESIMTPAVNTVEYSEIADVFGSNESIVKINSTAVRFSAETFHPYMKEIIFGEPILPEHILNPATGGIDYADWDTSYFNAPNATHGPIGYGPYKFVTYDTTGTTLEKWDSYPQVLNHTNVEGIDFVKVTTVKDSTAALTGLINGEIDIVDSQTGLSAVIDQIVSPAKA
ncbi:MAG: ABC transporter substrate-binding protein, partial [Candidatus Kariarchaeaceae archaeon]